MKPLHTTHMVLVVSILSYSVVMTLAAQAFDMHEVSSPFTSCILSIPLHHHTLWPGTQASIPGNYQSFTSTSHTTEYTLRFQLAYAYKFSG